MELLYATKNPAKIEAMRRRTAVLGITIYGFDKFKPNKYDFRQAPDRSHSCISQSNHRTLSQVRYNTPAFAHHSAASISIDIKTGKYYYDLAGSRLDEVAVEDGFLTPI